MKKQTLLIIVLITLAMATRLLPHWPNFTAVGAVALFAGAYLSRTWWAYLIPLLALFLSDLVLNNTLLAQYFEGFTWFTGGFYWIYAAMLLSVVIGRFGIKSLKPLNFALAGGGSALLFFLITNFGAWLGNPLYTQDFAGLMSSYTAGLPFLAYQAGATFFYSALLFGAASLLLPQPDLEYQSA